MACKAQNGLVVACLFVLATVSTKFSSNLYRREKEGINLKLNREIVTISKQTFSKNIFSNIEGHGHFNITFLHFSEVFKGCGRMKNRLLKTTEDELYCARYRDNFSQIQGEHISSTLAKILAISNVPQTNVIQFKTSSPAWRDVSGKLLKSGWKHGSFVILTKYISSLQPIELPDFLKNGEKIDKHQYNNFNESEILNLKTWTDLVIFDYLTGNIDRVVGQYFNRQWDRDALEYPAHNIMVDLNGSLVFLDNESGFQHSYSLLSKYQTFHDRILKMTCIFYESTVKAIKQLQANNYLIEELVNNRLLSDNLNQFRLSPKIISILKERIFEVHEHIENCT